MTGERDDFMRRAGYPVLRVWNVDALRQITAVCETMLAELDGRQCQDVKSYDLRFVFAAAKQQER